VKNIVFDPKAFKEFNELSIENKKLYKKIGLFGTCYGSIGGHK